ncbi:YjcZ family sporulation protein [Solibacillus sp. FSL K6-1523]|uniref:YjcZ family sporulation protein n=1 Tax=Solibacillus sp. FSL K6-1523 TaxID=2921471 RepID=UPI0030FA8748
MGYSNNACGYDNCSCNNYNGGYGGGNKFSFVLLVVLFILLIIVGASFVNKPC